jgi:4-hydroxybenzoate polyprenyltransferase
MSALRPSKLAAWLALMRLSNLPTVLSNVWTGLALGYFILAATGQAPPVSGRGEIAWRLLQAGWLMLVAGSCFYIAGMVLNDVTDRRFDARDRPDRPLPAAQISLSSARLVVIVALIAGLMATAGYSTQAVTFALLLVGSIAAYNLTHKYIAASVVFMGLCRAVLYPLGAAALLGAAGATHLPLLTIVEASWPWMGAVGLYIILATYVARGEHTKAPGSRRWLGLAMVVLPLLGLLRAWPSAPGGQSAAVVAGTIAVLWLGWCAVRLLRYRDTPGVMQRWLAGLCLFDAFFLSVIGLWPLAAAPIALFGITRVCQRKIIGT